MAISMNSAVLDKLRTSSILVTGATGLIGKSLVNILSELSIEYGLDLKIIMMVRSKNKIENNLKKYIECGLIEVMEVDVTELMLNKEENVDYIIHAASVTDSKMMVESPVEVIMTNVIGTDNVLKLGKKAKSIVYLSSMESYGFTEEERLLKEDDIQYLNPLKVRSSYPESKRMCENLCISYFSEYGVPVKIVRLAQTFGRGVKKDDRRVFADFARKVITNEDIVLFTDGKSSRMYLDVEDAVQGILFVMLEGKDGEAYNIANKNTYCSIIDMANMVANDVAKGKISVRVQLDDKEKKIYPPPHRYKLDTSKIESLGWSAKYSLHDMYMRMMEEWEKADR